MYEKIDIVIFYVTPVTQNFHMSCKKAYVENKNWIYEICMRDKIRYLYGSFQGYFGRFRVRKVL